MREKSLFLFGDKMSKEREEELLKVLEEMTKPSNNKKVKESNTQQAYNLIVNMSRMELLFIKKTVDSQLEKFDKIRPKITSISDLEKIYGDYGDNTSNHNDDLV